MAYGGARPRNKGASARPARAAEDPWLCTMMRRGARGEGCGEAQEGKGRTSRRRGAGTHHVLSLQQNLFPVSDGFAFPAVATASVVKSASDVIIIALPPGQKGWREDSFEL